MEKNNIIIIIIIAVVILFLLKAKFGDSSVSPGDIVNIFQGG